MNRLKSQRTDLLSGTCPICGCMKTVSAWTAADLNWKTPGSFPYSRCKGCRSLFRPVGSTISTGAYPLGYGTYVNPVSSLIQSRIDSMANRRRAAFLESIRKPGTILDVGCGSGFFLAYLRARGWQVHGLDPAAEHVAFARDVLGLSNVVQGTWPPAEGISRHFDAIVMIHLIEHMSDPLTALTAARHSLCEGGTILLETPNIESWPARIFGSRWVTLDAPRHMVLFSPKSLMHCLRSAGFEKVRMTTYSPSTMEWSESLRYSLNLVRGKDFIESAPLGSSLDDITVHGSGRLTRNGWILKPFHMLERFIYRLLNLFANATGYGCNLLVVTSPTEY
jgi:2-polyprenyl-3-methyl-5-hydroxy-6-metoxy-1,4-benzoquinol methylase